MPKTSTPRRPRGSLDRDTVIDAALAIAENEGLDALSMSALATELDAGVMTLYGYVRNKRELLEALYERLTQDSEPLRRPRPGQSWDEFLREQALLGRREILERPLVMELYVSNALEGPVRVDLADEALQIFLDAGFTNEQAIRAYIAMNSYLHGFLAWEIPRFHLQTVEDYRRDYTAAIARLPRAPGPLAFEMRDLLCDRPLEEQFLFGLDLVLEGLRRLLNP